MAETNFIIGPSGEKFSMVSDEFFEALGEKEYSESTEIKIALDWLLNIKKFCVTEESDGSCIRGIYEATYGIEEYASYATPVTSIDANYKKFEVGGQDSDESTGSVGKVMETSARNPHRYTLQEDQNNSENAPSELTGEYLGAFFHHKGSWYASFDDLFNLDEGTASNKEITTNTKKAEAGSASKKIYVQSKFYPEGEAADIEECKCVADCSFSDSAGGGDEGYSQIFQLDREGIPTTLDIYFSALQIKDSITVTASSGQSYSSGCISGFVSSTLSLPNGATSITVEVTPNCEGGSGTAWSFSISCVNNAPP